jgi:hypothetical protein
MIEHASADGFHAALSHRDADLLYLSFVHIILRCAKPPLRGNVLATWLELIKKKRWLCCVRSPPREALTMDADQIMATKICVTNLVNQ